MTDSKIHALELAVQADPNDVGVRLLLARTLAAAGHYERALEQAQTLISREPSHSESIYIAYVAAQELGNSQLSSAYAAALPDSFFTPDDSEEEEVPRDPELSLDDIAGLEGAKDRLKKAFLDPIRYAELSAAFGKTPGGGLLLYGPPGCGKTMLGRALANTIEAEFIPVGLEDVVSIYSGGSELNIHEIFAKARAAAPAVLFFDEVDVLAMARDDRGNRGIVVQFLQELDGLKKDNDGIQVIGATNQPWVLDVGFLRPGRFGEAVFVPPPTSQARAIILSRALDGKPMAEDVNLDKIVGGLDGWSGADVADIGTRAVELALQESIDSTSLVPVGQNQLEQARATGKVSVRPWFSQAKSYVQFANDDGRYDDLAQYMKDHKWL